MNTSPSTLELPSEIVERLAQHAKEYVKDLSTIDALRQATRMRVQDGFRVVHSISPTYSFPDAQEIRQTFIDIGTWAQANSLTEAAVLVAVAEKINEVYRLAVQDN